MRIEKIRVGAAGMRAVILIAAGLWCLTAATEDDAPEGYKSAQEIVDSLKPNVRTRGIRVEASRPATLAVSLDIRFEFGSNRLTQDAKNQLAALGEALNSPQLAAQAFEIIGHTDAVGSAAYNLRLSGNRAAAVRDYLLANHQVTPDRLTASGRGEQDLLPGLPPEHPSNRRVEIRAR